MDTNSPGIRAFLSYSHADDEEFGVVEPLVKKLQAFVRAKSGRELEVFVDRESIGWGADWRASISSSVEGATIFVPLLSANYLDSEACREEFLAFHAKAEVLGVTELLLPILIFKSNLFSEDATDEIAQIAERIQYKCIEDPVLSGFQSPEWLQCTRDLAESLLAALAKAEFALLAAVPDKSSEAPDPADVAPPDDEEESGLAELMLEMEPTVAEMTAAAERLTPAIEALGNVPGSVGNLPESPSAKQFTQWSLRLANEFKAPSLELESAGKDLFEATTRLDETLIKLKRLTDSLGSDEASLGIVEGRRDVIRSFGDLREVAVSLEGMLTSMRPAEVMSVPLRNSLKPARRGVVAVRDCLKMIESWQGEFDD